MAFLITEIDDPAQLTIPGFEELFAQPEPTVIDTPRAAAPSGPRAKAAANLTAIRTLRVLQGSGRPADAAERDLLAAWSSWGALPKVFDDADTEWIDVRAQLRDLLSAEEWDAARRTTINAHYTPPTVVAAMWETAARLGFVGGRVLEPGCGSGNFIAAAPAGCEIVGVELDPVTAAIAQALHPGVDVRCEGFERSTFPDGWFDLAIGNVPFGDIRLHDPRHNAGHHTMHNHFIVKSLRLLAPGGIAALITSRYTMDSQSAAHRTEIAGLADLLGAVRLPSGAMKATAGTDVIADVLFLRRRADGAAAGDKPWTRTVPVDTPDGPVTISEYFAERPAMILGTLGARSGMYRADDVTVRALDGDLSVLMRSALLLIRPLTTAAAPQVAKPKPVAPRPAIRARDFDPALHQEGTILRTSDRGFCRLVNGVLVHYQPTSQKDHVELIGLLDLRDTVLGLLEAQASSRHDSGFAALQAELNARYDTYVARFGPLNRFTLARTGRVTEDGDDKMRRVRPRMGGFGDDPAFYTVMALEHFDPDDQTALKADIFTKRVVGPREQHTTAETAEDALALCLDEIGRVDLPRVAELLGCDTIDARSRLAGLVWDDPATETLVPAALYLSGNVREKLATAEAAAVVDERWKPNVAALREVLPDDLGPADIDTRLGSPLLTTADIEQFIMEELVDERRREWAHVDVDHAKITATWEVSIDKYLRGGLRMTSVWGTPRADAIHLLHASLNQTPASVYDTVDRPEGGTKQVLNPEETFAAREKQQVLAERFRAWVWEDAARSARIVETYNRLFNSVVLPAYDGSHLTLPGLNLAFRPHPHQLNAIWRILQSPAVLLAHPVGAGKTMVAAAAGMEMRRLGLINKPAFVVPNHMLDQYATEMLQLYPQAQILVPTKADMTPGGRKGFVARCAMGNWDAIILTHSAFERISVSATTAAGFLREKIALYRAAKEEEGSSRMTIKKLEAACIRFEARLQTLMDAEGKDDGVTFDASGIDYLFIDESQAHKNLPFATKIRSVGGEGSQRAADLEVKLQYLRSRVGRRVATFATATPIANTIAEMFVVQSYLQPDRLADAGIESFDAWAATFGSTITALELAPDGGSYRMHTRFARFHNVPELVTMFREVADVLIPADLHLPIPNVEGGKPTTVIVESSEHLRGYVAALVERARKIRAREVDPTEDNMLKVCGDGRKAALHLRLVDLPQQSEGKVGRCAQEVADRYHAHAERVYTGPDGQPSERRGSLQVVFCDLSTPRPGWNVYAELTAALVARGVPAGAIRYVHEAADARSKAELFAACRAGRVAVLLGSTGKMGIGTNVQTRLAALHHLDCPWRPDEIEQREGRGLRQGNQNASVAVLRYATEASFDVYMWQTVERKANFIHQVMRGEVTSREIEDISEQALSYAEMKALATGNPLIMEKAGVDNDVARLTRLRRAHHDDQRHIAGRLAGAEREASALEELIERCRAAIDRRRIPQPFEIVVADRTIGDRKAAGEALIDQMLRAVTGGATGAERTIGAYAGFPITAVVVRTPLLGRELDVSFDGAPITMRLAPADVEKFDASGFTMRLDHALRALDVRLEEAIANLATTEADIRAAKERQGAPFDQEQLLVGLQQRQADLAEQLAELEEKESA